MWSTYIYIYKYLGEAADSTADGSSVTCNNTSVHQPRCELGGTADIHLFVGWRFIGQIWTRGVELHVSIYYHTLRFESVS